MKHVVSFSGGKDSTSMLLMMIERGMKIDEIVCFDTGWEFPQMYDHWKQVEEYTGRKITILHPKKPFNYWLYEHEVTIRNENPRYCKKVGDVIYGWGWPNFKRRWCTGFKTDALSKGRRNEANYIGIAVDEPKRIRVDGKQKYPLVEWGITEAQALEYCYSKGFRFSGLYEHFRRVSCYCCPLQRVGDIRKLRKYYPQLWGNMLELDKKIYQGYGQFKGGKTLSQWEERFSKENLNKLF